MRIFLAEGYRLVRDGFRALLEAKPGMEVVGDAGNGREAVRQVAKEAPDLVIMDAEMPELNGIEATRQICRVCPSIKVIILTAYSAPADIARAFKAGARGYILKDSSGEDLISAVRTVSEGRVFLCGEVWETVVGRYLVGGEEAAASDPLGRLSDREREILQLLVEGKTNARIAEMLHLSPKTVETYRSHLMQKLGISDMASLVKFAIRNGLTSLL